MNRLLHSSCRRAGGGGAWPALSGLLWAWRCGPAAGSQRRPVFVRWRCAGGAASGALAGRRSPSGAGEGIVAALLGFVAVRFAATRLAAPAHAGRPRHGNKPRHLDPLRMAGPAAQRHDRLHLGGDGAAGPRLMGGHRAAERGRNRVALAGDAGGDRHHHPRPDRRGRRRRPGRYLPFIGTLFLFIATANVLAVVPGYQPPTGSLSTTAALAICVLIAVPLFSIGERGLGGYLRTYCNRRR
jgi:hypothetical protein